jgi:hypothetical protein
MIIAGHRIFASQIERYLSWDCVTQFEAVATCERLGEAFLLSVLEELLMSFPFVIRGFHSDNGSEYVNRRVAQLLNKFGQY